MISRSRYISLTPCQYTNKFVSYQPLIEARFE